MPLPPPPTPERQRLLEAILPHVPFDGWSPAALAAAVRDCGLDPAGVRGLVPQGALDLAADLHRAGDRAMLAALTPAATASLRFRERVAFALKARLAALPDREVLRRANALFALPQNAAQGARLIWGTADAVWTALGDTSTDVNWYTKRATLAAVWSATVLYRLGDQSVGATATQDFIDRRIADVMRIEEAKAAARASPILKPLAGLAEALGSRIRAPLSPPPDLPGYWSPPAR